MPTDDYYVIPMKTVANLRIKGIYQGYTLRTLLNLSINNTPKTWLPYIVCIFSRTDLCDTLSIMYKVEVLMHTKSTVSKSNLDNKRKLEVGAHT